MDPVSAIGLVASVIQLIGTTSKVIKYVDEIKDAPKERASLASEAANLVPLLMTLKLRVETSSSTDPWFSSVNSLGLPGGPLAELQVLMEQLGGKLKLRKKKLGGQLLWPSDQKECLALLAKIERVKTLIGLAMQDDNFKLSMTMRNDVNKLSNEVTTMNEDMAESQIRDNSGAGKTVLTSYMIDHLKRTYTDAKVGMAFVYCSYKDPEQTPENLMASLLRQFAQRLPSLPEEIKNMYQEHEKDRTRPSLTEYLRLLHKVARMFDQAFLLVDALDECKEDGGARKRLLVALRELSASFRVVVTSRWVPAIESEFGEALKLEIRADSKDVAEYVRSRIAMAPRLMRHLEADPMLESMISRKIVDNCHGMFLMAKLHMDSLTKQPHRKALRLALENLPPELDDTYDDALARINGQDKEDTKMAHHVLGWVTHATRALTMKQLQHALSVEPEQADLDEEILIDEELLISTCLGLVTVDHTSEEVRLVHYTAQKYFEQRLLDIFPDNHLRIASTCLTYMSLKTCQEIDELTLPEKIKALGDRYALLDYAGSNWVFHAQRDERKLLQQILRFLSPRATYLSSRIMVGGFISLTRESRHRHVDYPVKYEARVSGHHMAAYFGLEHTLKALLSEASDPTDMINSALLICSVKDYRALAQLLLDHNANINIRSWLGYTPLLLAIKKGSLAMTKLLLDRNADVNMRPTCSPVAPLNYVAEDGFLDLLQPVLEHFAKFSDNRNYTDHPAGLTALRLAVLKKDLASVNVLLDGGADIDALHLTNLSLSNPVESKIYEFRTTVLFDAVSQHGAVSQQDEDIANLLLDRGADVDMGDVTPLCRAVSQRNGRIVSLLIEKGPDLQIPRALKQLSEKGSWCESYQMVFSEESPSKNFLGQALVGVAKNLESGTLAETLINSGADINLLSINKARLCHLEWIGEGELLQYAFDWDDDNGALLDFPLFAAWRSDNKRLMRFLLDHGAKKWGINEESWLQQAVLAEPEATEPVEGPSLEEAYIWQFIRVLYGKIMGSDDFREILRKNEYPEVWMDIIDRIDRRIGEEISQERAHRCLGIATPLKNS